MNLPTLSVTLYILLEATRASLTEHEQRQERLFRARSDYDWASVWHQESHVRCRENLEKHLFWACEKDIYKLSRKKRRQWNYPELHLMKKSEALTLLRKRRSTSGSITDECCNPKGCTWEEYAEYCPDNKRIRTFHSSK